MIPISPDLSQTWFLCFFQPFRKLPINIVVIHQHAYNHSVSYYVLRFHEHSQSYPSVTLACPFMHKDMLFPSIIIFSHHIRCSYVFLIVLILFPTVVL